MNTDGISYLDIGSAIATGDWRAGIHAYWSPLYPCLIAIALKVFHPSSYSEFTVVHFVNFCVFLGSACAFQFLMSSALRDREFRSVEATPKSGAALPAAAFLILGNLCFLYSSLTLVNLAIVSPDLLVSLFFFLASALVIRMRTQSVGPRQFALLGFLLGLGYLAKTPMLPLGVIFLICGAFAARTPRTGQFLGSRTNTGPKIIRDLSVGFAVFVLIAVPFVGAISKSKHQLTIGYNATLNWAWNINHAPRYHWEGDVPGLGVPLHPSKKLFASPAVYSFDGPVQGTYPAWFDPSYWFEGIKLSMNVKTLCYRFIANLRFYIRVFLWRQIGIAALCLFLLLLAPRGILHNLADQLGIFIPAAIGLLMYAPVYVESRYILGFVVLIWLVLLSAVRLPDSYIGLQVSKWAVGLGAAYVFVALALSVFMPAKFIAGGDAFGGWNSPHVQFQIAEKLQKFGLHSGDKVAWIRPAVFDQERRYDWARLDRLRIVAEIPGADEDVFWAAPAETQRQVLKAFEETGAKAVIATERLNGPSALPWRSVGTTGYYILILRN
jgi:hypothetical protein